MNSTTPHKSCGKRYYLNLSTVLKRHYSSDFIIMCTERLSSVLKHLNTYLTANMVEWKYTIRSSHSTSLLLIKCIIKLLCKRGNNPYIASVFYVWYAHLQCLLFLLITHHVTWLSPDVLDPCSTTEQQKVN